MLGANAIERRWFDSLFGVVLAVTAAWLAFPRGGRHAGIAGTTRRNLTDATGTHYRWSFDLRLGLAGSVVVGIVSALFGIGGGPIQVPFLIALLNYPEHVATATSHAVLAVTWLAATLIHVRQHDDAGDLPLTASMAAGALAGAPLGARLSRRLPGTVLVRVLAAMLGFIALRLIYAAQR